MLHKYWRVNDEAEEQEAWESRAEEEEKTQGEQAPSEGRARGHLEHPHPNIPLLVAGWSHSCMELGRVGQQVAGPLFSP